MMFVTNDTAGAALQTAIRYEHDPTIPFQSVTTRWTTDGTGMQRATRSTSLRLLDSDVRPSGIDSITVLIEFFLDFYLHRSIPALFKRPPHLEGVAK